MSTMVGGGSVTTSLSPADEVTAAKALEQLGGGTGPYDIETSLSAPPNSSGTTIYNITPAEGSTVTLPAGAGGIVLGGDNDATINGNGAGNSGDPSNPGEVLVGNNANDTFNIGGGAATIVTGTGSNTVNLTSGTALIDSGGGAVTVNLTSGEIISKGDGPVTINGQPGSTGWFTSDSGGQVNLGAGTSISLGTGNDTITALGAATVLGGYDSTVFQGDTNSTFLAGQGNETLYGGSGTTYFVGSNTALGTDYFQGGSGANTMVGGNNRDTMVSAGTSDLFAFTASVGGGNHTIVGYSASTGTIDLAGYTAANVSESVVGGNTVITLTDGTVITVDGVTDPSSIALTYGSQLSSSTFNPNLPSGQASVPTTTGYTLGGTDGTATLVGGSAPLTLSSGTTSTMLTGNSGNDTFNVGTGGGIVAAGSGNDTINTTGGKVDVNTGAGANVINDSNTDLTLYGSGDDTVNVTGTSNYLSALGAHVNVADGAAIQLGVGDDTVTALGSATVSGGYNNIVFHGGTNSTVYAGAGIETLFGGTGTTNFYGSTVANAFDSMVGGSGANNFVGGVNADTMVSGASLFGKASTDIFDFSSSISGGNHTIVGFTASNDTIQLHGYASKDISSVQTISGSSVISLDDGTTITLKGIANFDTSTIKFS